MRSDSPRDDDESPTGDVRESRSRKRLCPPRFGEQPSRGTSFRMNFQLGAGGLFVISYETGSSNSGCRTAGPCAPGDPVDEGCAELRQSGAARLASDSMNEQDSEVVARSTHERYETMRNPWEQGRPMWARCVREFRRFADWRA